MMKRTMLAKAVMLAFGLSLCNFSLAAIIEDRLAQEIASLPPSATIDVILNLNTRVDTRTISGPSRAEKLANIVRALRSHAQLAQPGLLRFLRSQGIRPSEIWLNNSIAATVPVSLIPALSQQPSLAEIKFDRKVEGPAPRQAPTSDAVLDAVNAALLATPGWNGSSIRANELWALGYAGQGVTVAIMDTGVDILHADLQAAYRGGTNSWFDPNGEHTTPYDKSGHGTQVTGLVLGADASGQTIGVAPGATWMAVKIFNDAGVSTISRIHQGFQWLLDPDGVPATNDAPDIVNNSWNLQNTENQCNPEFDADIQILKAAGLAVVFSAGNSGPYALSSVSPANGTQTLSVGAVDEALNIALFSSRGPSPCGSSVYPRITAPGVNLLTADLTFGGLIPDSYVPVSGTSFAAPHLTGALALLKSAHSTRSYDEIEAALLAAALDLGAVGPDHDYGAGFLNVAAAHTLLSGGANGSAPVAGADSATLNEDTTATINVLANDSADTAVNPANVVVSSSIVITTSPLHGSLIVNVDGSIQYMPNANYVGNDQFSYTVNDSAGLTSNPALVSLAVSAVNDAPVISGQMLLSTSENTALTILLANLSVNDVDNTYPNGFSLTLLPGANYSVSAATITPVAGFNGLLTVPVQVNDGAANSNTFTLSVTVTAVNAIPQITGQAVLSVVEDSGLTLALGNFTVTDADDVYPTNFTLTVLPGANYSLSGATLSPVANFNGSLIVPVRVNDGTDYSNTFNASVSVSAVNDAPVIIGQTALSTLENTALTLTLADLTVSDVDNGYPTGFALLVLPGANYSVSGSMLTPVTGFSGNLAVPVQVNDGLADSTTFNLSITVSAINHAPVANNDSYSIAEGLTLTVAAPGVLQNDSDPDGNAMSVVNVNSSTATGTVVIAANGALTYTPAAGSAGRVDSLTYTISDGVLSSTATLSISISSPPPPATNRVPVLSGDGVTYSRSKYKNLPMKITVAKLLLNDRDPDDANFPLGATFKLVDKNLDGIADTELGNSRIVDNGDGTLSYSPAGTVSTSSDKFKYYVIDSRGGVSKSATVSVTVVK